MVEGNKEENAIDDNEIIALVNRLVEKGMSKKDAVECVSDILKVKKNYVKDLIK